MLLDGQTLGDYRIVERLGRHCILIHETFRPRAREKLASEPVYQRMTIRNWNTSTKLLAMMSES